MQKFRFLPVGIMAGLVFLALLGSCNTDQRAKGFEEYIIAQTDSVALTLFTVPPMYEHWLKSYSEDPGGAGHKQWIKRCRERLKHYAENIKRSSLLIHRLDSMAGRELTYPEAYNYIMELVDTGLPDEFILMKRTILAQIDNKENVMKWEAYKDRLARDCGE